MDSDDFVTIGTVLPQGDDEEILSRKPVAVHDQVVRDDQGRIRFHGAFTGGFSAGYFNSVDTKEGWVPKHFKSSRSQRNEHSSQKPEDFMDGEDFGEFGIAPKRLFANKEYQDNSLSKKHAWTFPGESSHSLFSNPQLLHCIEPAKLTVGQKLLKRIGWRSANVDQAEQEDAEEDNFGCALPPNFKPVQTPKRMHVKNESEIICPVDFSMQITLFGIGYKGLKSTEVIPEEIASSRNKRKGISGQAFGIGALEEDDDYNIYSSDRVSNYHTALCFDGEEEEEEEEQARRSRPGAAQAIKSSKVKRERRTLEGFQASSAPPIVAEIYPPPQLVKEFMSGPSKTQVENNSCGQKSGWGLRNNFKRGETLGEKPNISSVFELISDNDKRRIEEAKRNFDLSKSQGSEKPTESNIPAALPIVKQNPPPMIAANDDTKAVIETFHASVESAINENLTEWEREQKRDGADKTVQHGLGTMMGRFVKASQGDQNDSVSKEATAKSDKEKAAALKMFGLLTRETVTWHPAKLLCVRFNIEDPYPESTIVGLPTQKQSKRHPTFVKAKNDEEAGTTNKDASDSPLTETKPRKPEDKPPAPKPLAILSTVDLRPSTSEMSDVTLIPADNYEHLQQGIQEESPEDESDEEMEVPPPSMDIFKAIFEDSDGDDDDDDDDDDIKGDGTKDGLVQQSPMMTDVQIPTDQSGLAAPTGECIVDKPMVKSDDEHLEDTAPDRKKHKKEKHRHKKHKHSHKHKKQKKSKKGREKRSDDEESDDSQLQLSRDDKILLARYYCLTIISMCCKNYMSETKFYPHQAEECDMKEVQ